MQRSTALMMAALMAGAAGCKLSVDGLLRKPVGGGSTASSGSNSGEPVNPARESSFVPAYTGIPL